MVTALRQSAQISISIVMDVELTLRIVRESLLYPFHTGYSEGSGSATPPPPPPDKSMALSQLDMYISCYYGSSDLLVYSPV